MDDGRPFAVRVFRPAVLPARVFRVDIASGRRTQWREIVPRDTTGVVGVYNVVITPDGRSVFYSYQQNLSELYIVEGVK